MHSPFTFNPNAHRAPSNYQQQSGGPLFTIGAFPPTIMTHQPQNFFVNHNFTRSFASVVSCESDLMKRQNTSNVNNSNSGSILEFFKHFANNKQQQQMPMQQKHHQQQQHKEFEDFTNMPVQHRQQNFYSPPQPVNNLNMKIPVINAAYYPPPSAKPTPAAKNFMAQFFGSSQRPSKPKGQQGWFRRCNGRGWRGYSPKFRDHDVNLKKNAHEKERISIEQDIRDDCCDFVDVMDEKDAMSDVTEQKKRTETAMDDDPPFEIYSMEEFPAIETAVAKKSSPPPSPAKQTKETCEEGFVVLPSEASISTPSFIQPRLSFCEKIMKSPQKLFCPRPLPIALKPCLKPSRRRTMSECSDDFIVFASDSGDCQEDDDEDYSDESDVDDEDDDNVDGHDMSGITEEESSDDDMDDDVKTPEHQIDSGMEEKRVRFNSTPKVHVMRVWDFAYRTYRKGDYWMQKARDHERFKKRIENQENVLNLVLDPNHREKIYHERFEEAAMM